MNELKNYLSRKKKTSGKFISIMLVSLLIFSAVFVIMQQPEIEVVAEEEEFGSDLTYFSSAEAWDTGNKSDTTSANDRYNQTFDALELDFPYASKSENLEGYWRLENSSISDETFNTANGSIIGIGTPEQIDGKFGLSYNFTWAENYRIEIPNNDIVDIYANENFTIMFWTKLNPVYEQNYARFVSSYNVVDGWELALDNNGDFVTAGIKSNAGSHYKISSTTNISDNQWHFISLNRTGSILTLIIDNSDIAVIDATSGNLSNDVNIRIALGRTGGNDLEGIVDELKMYNKSLSADELTYIYNSGNQYKTTGNWSTPLISNLPERAIDGITVNLSFGDDNNYIDKIEILNSAYAIISTANANINTSTSLTFSDFDNGFSPSEGIDTYTKIYLVGNGTASPSITNLSYTMSYIIITNRAYVTSYYTTTGTIEGFINSTKYDDNIYGWLNESQTNYEMGYGQKEWGYFSENAQTWTKGVLWDTGGHYNVTWGGQANRSGLYAVIQTAEMGERNGTSLYYDNVYRMRYRINDTTYHEYSIVPDESYTYPQFTAMTIHNFSAVSTETIELGYIVSFSAYNTKVRNKRVVLIPLTGQNNTDYYYNEPSKIATTTSWQNASILNITQTNADDDWMILMSADVQMGDRSNVAVWSTETRACIDTINYSYASMESELQKDNVHFDWEDFFFVNTTNDLSIGTHALQIQGKETINNFGNISNAQILALKVQSHFPQLEIIDNHTLQSNDEISDFDGDDNPMVSLNVTSDFSMQYPFLTFVNSIYYNSLVSAGVTINTTLRKNGTPEEIYGTPVATDANITGYERDGMSDTTDRLVYASFKKHELNASVEYWYNTSMAPRTDGGTTYHIEGRINTVSMATPEYELSAILNITEINKTNTINYTLETKYVLTADEITPTLEIYNYTSTTWNVISFNPTKDGIEHNFSYVINASHVSSENKSQIKYTILTHTGSQTDFALDTIWIIYNQDLEAPDINDPHATPSAQRYNYYLNLSANITDDNIIDVWIIIGHNLGRLGGGVYTEFNHTMLKGAGDLYYHNDTYDSIYLHNYTIYAEDIVGNQNNSGLLTFNIYDDVKPDINWVNESADPVNVGTYMNITTNITNHQPTPHAYLNISYPDTTIVNYTMTHTGDIFYYNQIYNQLGLHNYTIWTYDDYSNVNSTSANFTVIDKPIITFISQTPSEINITSTGNMSIIFNITTYNTAINTSSIVFAHATNHTNDNTLNSSYKIPTDINQPDSLRAEGRNDGGWYEIFNASGTGELGYFGEWTADTVGDELVVIASGSNWTLVNYTVKIPHYFSSIWYVDKEALIEENKTDQYIDVYGKYSVRNWYNMSGTEFATTQKEDNFIRMGFYAEPNGEPLPLEIYLANDSYVSGNPSASPYAVLIGQVQNTDNYSHLSANSSYYSLTFSTNDTGYVNTLYLTDNFSFIYKGGVSPVDTWHIFFADDNYTHNGYYHNLNNTWFEYTSSNTWVSWTWRNGTIDAHIHFFDSNSNDTIVYKAYAETVESGTGNGTWSDSPTNVLNETQLPPNTPSIQTPNGSISLYDIGDIILIEYEWIGDPNNNSVFWNNLTLHNESGVIKTYIQNRTVTKAESLTTHHWYYNWTIPIGAIPSTGYYITITITDDTNLTSSDIQNGTFEIVDNLPQINNLSVIPDPQEFGEWVNISVNITDNGVVDKSWILITYPNTTVVNTTMNKSGNNYFLNQTYTSVGLYNFTIWANDTEGNMNYTSGNFAMLDSIPVISNIIVPSTTENNTVNISSTIANSDYVAEAYLNITYPDGSYTNVSMLNDGALFWELATYDQHGEYGYTMWITSTSNVVVTASGAFTIEMTQQEYWYAIAISIGIIALVPLMIIIGKGILTTSTKE